MNGNLRHVSNARSPSPSVWLVGLTAFVATLFGSLAAYGTEASSFEGKWDSTWGVIVLDEDGDAVRGTYTYSGSTGTIDGTTKDGKLRFRWSESNGTAGDGRFDISDDGGAFTGEWKSDGSDAWQPWNGVRVKAADPDAWRGNFSGLFDTSYGPMRLEQDGDEVDGTYLMGATEGKLDGSVEEGRYTFRYREPSASGEGWFELADDGQSFTGSWLAEGASQWKPWSGTRVLPRAGVTWLVIVEAHWERSLADAEYSFGEMLQTFFERAPSVKVRHRRMADRRDFERVGVELAYLAEPVVLLVSGHGTPAGVVASNEVIAATEIIDVVKRAPNVELVHFSSCDVMAGGIPDEVFEALPKGRELAISGYEVSVDWAGSAVFEMLYLDLILVRRLAPRAAGELAKRELSFADASETPGSPIGALHFRLQTTR